MVYSDQHGMDQMTNTEGTVATVICDSGTKLVGPGSAVCSTGEWSVEDVGQCKPLGKLSFGGLCGRNKFGARIVSCSANGVATRSRLNGRIILSLMWKSPQKAIDINPTTAALACPRLREIPNGKLEYVNAKSETLNPQIGVISPGTTARLRCLGKGKLVGARESLCNASEKWDPPIGTCK